MGVSTEAYTSLSLRDHPPHMIVVAHCKGSHILMIKEQSIDKDGKEYLNIKFWLDAIRAKFNCDWCARGELKLLITALQKKLSNAKNCKCS